MIGKRTRALLPLARLSLAAMLLMATLHGAPRAIAQPVAGGAPMFRSVADMPASPSCDGAHDLVVDGGKTTITGTQTFDRVCVVDGGVLRASGTLRAGLLYVDGESRISADGVPSVGIPLGCQYDGDNGSTLRILAREATVRGPISADGLGGLVGDDCGDNHFDGGQGGNGGALTLEAETLDLHSRLSAAGGDGGPGYYGDDQGRPGNSDDSSIIDGGGSGGNGGTVTVVSAHIVRTQADVSGGKAGLGSTAGRGNDGRAGRAGHISITTLTSAQRAALPPPPSPLVTTLASPPPRLPVQPDTLFGATMRCGPGDLRVTPDDGDVELVGVHRYPHICVYDGGTLRLGPHTTLQARTLLVAKGGGIRADGAVSSSRSRTPDGRYESGGSCGPDRVAPHAGIPGAPGDPKPGTGDILLSPAITPAGGYGGGAMTLMATRTLVAGTISVDGAAGESGQDTESTIHNVYGPWAGAGGGSGGGILLVAQDLQLEGRVSAQGGAGGHRLAPYAVFGPRPSGYQFGDANDDADSVFSAENGRHGGPGCIKLFANTLRTPAGGLQVFGPTVIGRP